MESKDYTSMTREQLIEELEKQKKYYRLVITASIHYAMRLIDELKALEEKND